MINTATVRQHTTAFNPDHSHVPDFTMICSLTIANVKQLVVYLALLAVFTIGSAMKSFPFLKSFICESFDLVTHSKLPLEQYWNSLFSWEMFHNVWHCVFLDLNKKVSLGNRAYNCPVVSVDGQNCFRLLDQMKSNRPLVLNFGSASCPIFMEHLKEFARMVKEFGHVADFLIVYIEEAHPSDGWKFEVRLVLKIFVNRVISS